MNRVQQLETRLAKAEGEPASGGIPADGHDDATTGGPGVKGLISTACHADTIDLPSPRIRIVVDEGQGIILGRASQDVFNHAPLSACTNNQCSHQSDSARLAFSAASTRSWSRSPSPGKIGRNIVA